MFLGILNTIWFHFSNNPFHLELMIRSIQIVVITSFVIIWNVGIKRVGCLMKKLAASACRCTLSPHLRKVLYHSLNVCQTKGSNKREESEKTGGLQSFDTHFHRLSNQLMNLSEHFKHLS